VLTLVLVAAAAVSIFGDLLDAVVILAIVVLSRPRLRRSTRPSGRWPR
jgi:hypothetical protein